MRFTRLVVVSPTRSPIRSPSDLASSTAARPASIACAATSVATRLTRVAGEARRFLVRATVLFLRVERRLVTDDRPALLLLALVPVERRAEAVLFFFVAVRDGELLLRLDLGLPAAFRLVGFRAAVFAFGLPRDDFLVVAIRVTPCEEVGSVH